ncbi:hypothetical protein [uncultured Pelagimonas sp.]|uniref:hypothetical protein n=1 Tax=uncultured Pelagimonas sp. TaxID=1618102 RepID=UPI0026274822|nr:hypothetical protein [uncultured Pelagimonas sp.]
MNIKSLIYNRYLNATQERGIRYQVIGERCSGTNFVDALIQSNFDIKRSKSYGWKHGFPTFTACRDTVLYVAVSRDAFSWIKSMYVRPYHAKPPLPHLSFPEFIRAQWDCEIDLHYSFSMGSRDPRIGQTLQLDRHPIEGRCLKNITELRALKLHAHLSLQDRQIQACHFKLDDIIADPRPLLQRVAQHCGQDLPEQVSVPQKHFAWDMPDLNHAKRKEAAQFTPQDHAFVLEALDSEIEARAGYAYSTMPPEIEAQAKG